MARHGRAGCIVISFKLFFSIIKATRLQNIRVEKDRLSETTCVILFALIARAPLI